jgi:transposase
MSANGSLSNLSAKYKVLRQYLDERTLRICAAAEALGLGHGGVSQIAKACGLSRTTVHAGIEELKRERRKKPRVHKQRVRKPGGGRRLLTKSDQSLLCDLEGLVDPVTRGDPESPLRWTCKSTTNLARELVSMGHRVSQRTVYSLLSDLGYSMQSNRKRKEGSDHPDRDAQFLYLSNRAKEFQRRGKPVISVDTKKKELIGEFRNAGREWSPKGQPQEVNIHDFADKDLGKVVPYGVYDIFQNQGWVSVGITHDTAAFAVEAIRRWWHAMGCLVYPKAKELLITADCGGSNGFRVKLWKVELQRLVNELQMMIHVCHFPPGTSKWNKIEHRMFCHITENWRASPLLSREVVVNLISSTTTNKGLRIQASLDEANYETGIKVTDEQLRSISIKPADFHGDWNYTIKPRRPS